MLKYKIFMKLNFLHNNISKLKQMFVRKKIQYTLK